MSRARAPNNLVSAVAGDHRRILQLAARLTPAEHADPLPARELRVATERLVMAACRHEAAEEQYLWPVARDLLDRGGQLAAAGLRQEREAKVALARLERATHRPGAPAGLAAEVAGALRAHVDYEETRILAPLDAELGAEEGDRLGALFERARGSGPTRPHLWTPAVPGVLRVAGRTTARLDHLRDFVGLRGH